MPSGSSQDCDEMQAEYDVMRTAITEGRVVARLDHDEALLTILYNAAGQPCTPRTDPDAVESLPRVQDRRGAGDVEAADDDPLWKYQLDLIAAVRKSDAAAAAAVNDASLVNATDRIRSAWPHRRRPLTARGFRPSRAVRSVARGVPAAAQGSDGDRGRHRGQLIPQLSAQVASARSASPFFLVTRWPWA